MRDSRRAVLVDRDPAGPAAGRRQPRDRQEFNTPGVARSSSSPSSRPCPPILAGLAGKAVNVGTLGGYLQYKYGIVLPDHRQPLGDPRAVGDARGRGAARQPGVRRRDGDGAATDRAREAVRPPDRPGDRRARRLRRAAHSSGSSVHGLPGDEITVRDGGRATPSGSFLLGIAAGAVAFALAPFVGRGSAAGVAGAVMFGGFIVNGYQAAIPTIAPLANLTWFGWTSNHVPLAGQFDWVSLAPGRDRRVRPLRHRRRGVRPARHRRHVSPIPTPSLPRALVGLQGPTGRAIGQNLPIARSPGASGSACSGWRSPAPASRSSTSSARRPTS